MSMNDPNTTEGESADESWDARCPNCLQDQTSVHDKLNRRCDNPNCRVVVYRPEKNHENITTECGYSCCHTEAEKIVWYEDLGRDGSERYYCSEHARKEVQKHEDATVQDDYHQPLDTDRERQ